MNNVLFIHRSEQQKLGDSVIRAQLARWWRPILCFARAVRQAGLVHSRGS